MQSMEAGALVLVQFRTGPTTDGIKRCCMVHAQHDGVCDCVLYSIRLRPGAKLH